MNEILEKIGEIGIVSDLFRNFSGITRITKETISAMLGF